MHSRKSYASNVKKSVFLAVPISDKKGKVTIVIEQITTTINKQLYFQIFELYLTINMHFKLLKLNFLILSERTDLYWENTLSTSQETKGAY